MIENKEKSVPLYTKAGWVAAWIVMLVIAVMILRNCATAVIYGSKTEQETVDQYYTKGEKVGRAGLEAAPQDLVLENPVLRKAYIKGYREGLDVYKFGEKK
jgi:hypothetical protein